MITGQITVDHVRGFMVVTDEKHDSTEIRVNDGKMVFQLHWTADTATDLANAIRASVAVPGRRVTSVAMREMRAKETERIGEQS